MHKKVRALAQKKVFIVLSLFAAHMTGMSAVLFAANIRGERLAEGDFISLWFTVTTATLLGIITLMSGLWYLHEKE